MAIKRAASLKLRPSSLLFRLFMAVAAVTTGPLSAGALTVDFAGEPDRALHYSDGIDGFDDFHGAFLIQSVIFDIEFDMISREELLHGRDSFTYIYLPEKHPFTFESFSYAFEGDPFNQTNRHLVNVIFNDGRQQLFDFEVQWGAVPVVHTFNLTDVREVWIKSDDGGRYDNFKLHGTPEPASLLLVLSAVPLVRRFRRSET